MFDLFPLIRDFFYFYFFSLIQFACTSVDIFLERSKMDGEEYILFFTVTPRRHELETSKKDTAPEEKRLRFLNCFD